MESFDAEGDPKNGASHTLEARFLLLKEVSVGVILRTTELAAVVKSELPWLI